MTLAFRKMAPYETLNDRQYHSLIKLSQDNEAKVLGPKQAHIKSSDKVQLIEKKNPPCKIDKVLNI